MLDIPRNDPVLVHEFDLRQHCSLSARARSTWNCVSGAILDADDLHRHSNRFSRDRNGPISRSGRCQQLESVAILQRSFAGRPICFVAIDNLDFDADVTCTALHRSDVIFTGAIQSVLGALRAHRNEWTRLSHEDIPPACVGDVGEFWTFGDWTGLPLGDYYDVVSLLSFDFREDNHLSEF